MSVATCTRCGTEFPAARSTAKFCSNACRQRAYRTRTRVKDPLAQIELINRVNDAFFRREAIATYLPEVKRLWIRELKKTIKHMEQSLAALDEADEEEPEGL
jgi:predicted ribosome quality control (RQC) complex YloA/Tae2 family protein